MSKASVGGFSLIHFDGKAEMGFLPISLVVKWLSY